MQIKQLTLDYETFTQTYANTDEDMRKLREHLGNHIQSLYAGDRDIDSTFYDSYINKIETLNDAKEDLPKGVRFIDAQYEKTTQAELDKILEDDRLFRQEIISVSSEKDDYTFFDTDDIKGNPANLRDLDLSGLDFSGQDLTGISFANANLQGANFENCTLSTCSFSHTDLTDTNFKNTIMQNVSFHYNCVLKNTDFSNSSFEYSTQFYSSDLSNVNLKNIKSKNISFQNCQFSQVDFSKADLQGATFQNFVADKDYVEDYEEMGAVDLKTNKFDSVNFEDAKLDGVKFKNINIENCIIDRESLDKVYFDTDTTIKNISNKDKEYIKWRDGINDSYKEFATPDKYKRFLELSEKYEGLQLQKDSCLYLFKDSNGYTEFSVNNDDKSLSYKEAFDIADRTYKLPDFTEKFGYIAEDRIPLQNGTKAIFTQKYHEAHTSRNVLPIYKVNGKEVIYTPSLNEFHRVKRDGKSTEPLKGSFQPRNNVYFDKFKKDVENTPETKLQSLTKIDKTIKKQIISCKNERKKILENGSIGDNKRFTQLENIILDLEIREIRVRDDIKNIKENFFKENTSNTKKSITSIKKKRIATRVNKNKKPQER